MSSTNHNQHEKTVSGAPIFEKSPAGRRLGRFQVNGILKKGTRTQYSIAGEDIMVTSDTWIIGKVALGAIVRVQGVVIEGAGKVASKITVIGR